MAPYGGPTLAQLVPLLKKGLKESVALGSGIPRATLARKDGRFELRRLSGGEGFGVQADLVRPFVDDGAIAETSTWQEMLAWLCENWATDDWGAALDKGEELRITFLGQAFVAADLETARHVCQRARKAGKTPDFEPLQRRFVYEVVLVEVGDPDELVRSLKTHARLSAAKAKHAIANLPAVVYRNEDEVDADYVRRLLTGGGTRLKLVEREEK